MVGVLGDNHSFTVGDGSGDPPGQVIRFATRVDEEHDIETFREQSAQPVGVLDNVVHQVAGVGIEDGRLASNGRGNGRVAVADVGDVVVGIEEPLAVRAVHPYAFRFR